MDMQSPPPPPGCSKYSEKNDFSNNKTSAFFFFFFYKYIYIFKIIYTHDMKNPVISVTKNVMHNVGPSLRSILSINRYMNHE